MFPDLTESVTLAFSRTLLNRVFDSHEKGDSIMISVRPTAECPYVAKTLTLRFSRVL